jgi:hypothetical protein
VGVGDAGPDIVWLEIGIIREDFLRRYALGEEAQDQLDGDAQVRLRTLEQASGGLTAQEQAPALMLDRLPHTAWPAFCGANRSTLRYT